MMLSPVHAQHFTFDDWSVLSEIAVSSAENLDDPAALALALDNRGRYLFRRRLLADAEVAHSQALAIREQIGDQAGVLQSLNALGLIGLRTRELAQAITYFADTASRAREDGNVRWQGIAAMNLAEAHLESGHADKALEVVSPLPELFANRHEPAYTGNSLWLLSWARRLLGDFDAAQAAIGEALKIAEDASNRMWEAHWLTEAARVHLVRGDTDEAMRCCQMAASLQRQIGDPSREATALDVTGEVLLASGNVEDAAAFHQEAARMHRQLGDRWQEALATMQLADCETAVGRDETAREHMAQALALMQQFTDDRAMELRTALQGRLA